MKIHDLPTAICRTISDLTTNKIKRLALTSQSMPTMRIVTKSNYYWFFTDL